MKKSSSFNAWDCYKREKDYKEKHRIGKPLKKTVPLSSALDDFIGSVIGKDRFNEAQVLVIWEKVVGEKVARHARADRIDNGKLFVRVDDSVWRHQLLYIRKELISKLNSAVGTEVVKEIVLTG